MSRVVRAGLLTGITDGLFSSVLSVAFYDSTVTRLFHRPPMITVRWWVQLIGHIPFVGLPIVASLGKSTGPSDVTAVT